MRSAALSLTLSLALAGTVRAAEPVPVVLVTFEEAPLSMYAGGVGALEPTSPAALGTRKLAPHSPASAAYLEYLATRQAAHLARIEAAVGRPVEVLFRYRTASCGAAIRLSPTEAAVVARLPGVVRVRPVEQHAGAPDARANWVGADGVWDGSSTGGLGATKGEGIVVGILDTGIELHHSSFSATPADGHNYVNPFGSGNYVGACGAIYVCNDKLVGAWDYADPFGESDGPLDGASHGTHVASIAAGNALVYPAFAGVAPHANLISYDVCVGASCPLSATAAAVDQALLDGVDVLNYSVHGGTSPWSGDSDTYFLGAVAAGVFVSAVAGNGGAAPASVNHVGPWVAAVAGASHHRPEGGHVVELRMSGNAPAPADATGGGFYPSSYGPAPMVRAADFVNGDPDPGRCDRPFPPGTWTNGEIVLCDRDESLPGNPVTKGGNVMAGGAGAVVVGNLGGSSELDWPHPLPAIGLTKASADPVRAWLASGSGHRGTITASTTIFDPSEGDVMAPFSGKGPNAFDVLKPDVAMPGGGAMGEPLIWGAEPSPVGYPGDAFVIISGTSLASPHNAGAAALLLALHPGWSPTAVASVLSSTAWTSLRKSDLVTPADPLDVGCGRVDLDAAARAGIVLDETIASFQAANPALGGDPRTLNLSGLQDGRCAGSCTWRRTVRSVAPVAVTWSATFSGGGGLAAVVSPASFTLLPGASRQLTVTATPGGADLFAWDFGEVALTPDDPGTATAHLTLAVRQGSADFAAGEGHGAPNQNRVRLSDRTGKPIQLFLAYSAGQWGTNVATGDVDGDAGDEILTGPGPGAVFGPHVRAFDGSASPVAKISYYAYGTLRYGANVGGGALDADGAEELVTGPGPGDVFGPHVRGWNYDGASITTIAKINYFAYQTLRFGVNVVSGDLDRDGYAEIVTGAGPGSVFGAQIRGWNYDGAGVAAMSKVNFVAFAQPGYGVQVGAGDVEADGFAELGASPGPGGSAAYPARFLGFDYDGAAVAALPGFDATPHTSRYGGRLALSDLTGDGRAELACGTGPDPAQLGRVRTLVYDGSGLLLQPNEFVAFGASTYGVQLSIGALGI